MGQAGGWALTLQPLSWWGGPERDVTGAEPRFTHHPGDSLGGLDVASRKPYQTLPLGVDELGLTRTLTFEKCVKMVRNLHLIVFMLGQHLFH